MKNKRETYFQRTRFKEATSVSLGYEKSDECSLSRSRLQIFKPRVFLLLVSAVVDAKTQHRSQPLTSQSINYVKHRASSKLTFFSSAVPSLTEHFLFSSLNASFETFCALTFFQLFSLPLCKTEMLRCCLLTLLVSLF